MKTRELTPRLKQKKKLRRRKLVPMPESLITKDSSTETLSTAYPIAIYWDGDENAYVCELTAFNSVRLHATSWESAAAAAKVAHSLLITVYRANGYVLPEVG